MKKTRYFVDQVVWVTWLFFHPLKHSRLVQGSEADYQRKRAQIVQRFRGSMTIVQ